MKVLIFVTVCVACAVAQPQRNVQPAQLLQEPQQQQQQYQQPQQQQQQYQQPQQQHRFDDRVSSTTTQIPILSYNKEQGQDGSYKAAYSTGNHIQAEETGFLKERADQKPGGVLVQHGSYSYDTPEGEKIQVEYTADEFGFRATGDHIPTSPPVSPEIRKALDLIYAGIEANKQRSLKDPEFAKRQQEREQADYYGQYIPS